MLFAYEDDTMTKSSLGLLATVALLAGCANDCCTPYGYGYYYRPAVAVHVVPAYTAPVYATPVYATPVYAAPAYYRPAYATPAPVATWWNTCCIY